MQLLQMKARLLHEPQQQKVVKQLDAMLSRIEMNQLKSLQQQVTTTGGQGGNESGSNRDLAAARNWSAEIPFLIGEEPHQIGIRFRQDSAPEEEEEKMRWHVELNLEPPSLGKIVAHAVYHNRQLDLHFLSEEEQTASRISDQLDRLEAALAAAGIETGTIFSRQKTVHDPSPLELPHTTTRFSTQA